MRRSRPDGKTAGKTRADADFRLEQHEALLTANQADEGGEAEAGALALGFGGESI